MTENSQAGRAAGPLSGYRLIEIAGVGPTQLTGMLLADMGAEIVRVERLGPVDLGVPMPVRYKLMNRSRRSLAVDLKKPQGRDIILDMCASADALFEGFRPGVMERLGLGPEECLQRNEGLVYGRMTGWGQDGPLANTAGARIPIISASPVSWVVSEKKMKRRLIPLI